MSILERLAKSSASIKPQSGGFFPEGRDIQLQVVGLTLDPEATKPLGNKQSIPALKTIFKFQMVHDPEAPDPNSPRSFDTKYVDNYMLLDPEDAVEGPKWLPTSIGICNETVAKVANILVGQAPDRELSLPDLIQVLQAISQYLENKNNPRPIVIANARLKAREGSDIPNKQLTITSLAGNPVH